MRRVVVESPFAGDTPEERELHEAYLNACLFDCYRRNEAPTASHAIGSRCLDDDIPDERRRGIEAGYAWSEVADMIVVYVDLGISYGMKKAIAHALDHTWDFEYRRLGGQWATHSKTIKNI